MIFFQILVPIATNAIGIIFFILTSHRFLRVIIFTTRDIQIITGKIDRPGTIR